MEEKITKNFLIYFCNSLREICGENVAKIILRKAGMEEYLDINEEYGFEVLIPLEDFIRVRDSAREILGRSTNGVMYQAGLNVSTRVKIGKVGRMIISFASKFSNPLDLIEKGAKFSTKYHPSTIEFKRLGNTLYIIIKNCYECKGLRTNEPSCYMIKGFVEGIVKRLLNKEITMNEIECSAMGAPHCKFKISVKNS